MDEILGRAMDVLAERCAELQTQKDGAYLERNRVVAALGRAALMLGWKAIRTKTAIEGWSEDWHGCVRIELPTGQVSWHFHDSQAHLFAFLPEGEMEWDGHDTPEKYRRVDAFAQSGELVPVALGGEWVQVGRWDWQRAYSADVVADLTILRNGMCNATLHYALSLGGDAEAQGPAKFYGLKDLETARTFADRVARGLLALFGAGEGGE